MNGVLKVSKTALFVFIVPCLAFYSAMVLYPILLSIWYSLLDWDGIGESTFIGLKNYIEAFTDDAIFWGALKNTAMIVAGSLFVQVPIAIGLAILIHRYVQRSNFLVSSYFIPVILSVVVVGQLWKTIYSPASMGGMLNGLLQTFGLDSLARDWMADDKTAMLAIIVVVVWQYFGYHMLIQFTGVQNIPEDLFEAARIDGATGLQTAYKITLPLLAPVIKISVVLAAVGSLKAFDLVMAMTKGGPANLTEVLSSHFYNVSFNLQRFGYGSAISTILIILCLILTVVINAAFKRAEKSVS